MVQIITITKLFVVLTFLSQTLAFSQSDSKILRKIFDNIPVNESYEATISKLEADSIFKKSAKDNLLEGINGVDYYIGTIVDFSTTDLFDAVLKNSISIVKVINHSINSIIFRDTIEIISISLYYDGDECIKFKSQFNKLKNMIKKDTKKKSKNTFEDADTQKITYYYYMNEEELPFLALSKQTKGYSKGQQWFIINISHYRYSRN